jgi:hypothetical protein
MIEARIGSVTMMLQALRPIVATAAVMRRLSP